MKKLKVVIAVLFTIMLVVACDNEKQIETKKTSEVYQLQRPKNTNLGFWITEQVGNLSDRGYREIYGWMGAREFYGEGYEPIIDEEGNEHKPEYYVTYLVSAYPDYADGGQYITRIEITDVEVTVYGLTVNSSFEEFDKTFREMGYEIEVHDVGSYIHHSATKDGISFTLGYGDEVKPTFTIRAEVSNREGIKY